jgi:hypothetical protein
VLQGKGRVDNKKNPPSAFITQLLLIGFGISTTIGYFVYEIFLYDLAAEILTLFAFATPLIIYLLMKSTQVHVVRWRRDITPYAAFYSTFQFAYWYIFWVGMKHGNSSLALAVLPLGLFVSPLIVHFFTRTDNIKNWWGFSALSALIIIGIFSSKMDLPWNQMDLHTLATKLSRFEWFSTVCFLGAVALEGMQELIKRRMREAIEKAARDENRAISPKGLQDKIEAAANALTYQSAPICAAMSLAAVGILHISHLGTYLSSSSFREIGWYILWGVAISLFGFVYRAEVITRILQGKFGLRVQTVPPILAIRPAVFLIGSYLIAQVIQGIEGTFGVSIDTGADNLQFIQSLRNPDHWLENHWMLLTSILVLIVVFILRMWPFWWSEGFYTQENPQPE